MHRFFVSSEIIQNNYFTIEDDKVIKYVRNVLRLKPNVQVEIFDGEGSLYVAELTKITKNEIVGKITEQIDTEANDSKLNLTLAQSLPRAGKLDDIIRMNTEVGVNEFILFNSEYSLVRLSKFKENKVDRLMRVAVEASKQSERLIVPIVDTPISFDELMAQDSEMKILLHSREVTDSVDLKELKAQIQKENIKDVLVCIGPEGGFSPKEVELAKKNDFKIGYLNLPILRTETAGVVVGGLLLG